MFVGLKRKCVRSLRRISSGDSPIKEIPEEDDGVRHGCAEDQTPSFADELVNDVDTQDLKHVRPRRVRIIERRYLRIGDDQDIEGIERM